ncbi:hypothetical protein PF003_g3185 [Phytophthora fragariae]|nr:hypothetical protein PF003_g3185 [Phytophthora fragariae]
MEDQQDLMVEGVTAFAPSPAASYRYVIELKGSKMSIRMEDRTSKKQWYKCDMAKTDYVSTANAIPDATVADYVKSIDSVGFVVNGSDGVVKVCDSGLYTMSAIINSAPGSFQNKAQLLVNGKSVQSVYCNFSYTGGNQKTTSLSFTTALSEGDEVAVQCDSNLFDTSYKSGMAKTDFVTSGNTITDAEAIDYLKCFQDALDSDLDKSDEAFREVSFLEGGALRLCLAIAIRVLRSTRVAKFVFNLNPLTIERIDILESKLRDQQDELDAVRLHVDGGRVLPFVQLHATSKNQLTRLIWNKVNSDDFVTGIDGKVKVSRGGVYNVCASVTGNSGGNTTVRLLKNGTCIQVSYSFPSGGFYGSTSLNSIVRMDEGDVLEVTCGFDIWDTSYLSLARVGN